MSKKGNLKRILLCVGLITFSIVGTSVNSVECNSQYNTNMVIEDSVKDTINISEQIKTQLLTEVEKYIKTHAPKSPNNLHEYIVNGALENDIDICFMMSQTQVETNFGTLGIGRPHKKSLFGIYTRYSDYNTAVNDYITVLKTKYLVNGTTEYHLMKRYVTKSGHRYAQNKHYEVELAATYKKIKTNTNIFKLQEQYKNLILC